MNRIVHFEIHAADIGKAISFYESAFGWKFAKWPGPWEYYVIQTGDKTDPGIDGGLMSSRDGQPRTVNTIQVDSVDDYINRVESSGGSIVVPKMPIPGVGWLVYFKDPGGLIMGFMQPDRHAA